MVVLGLSGPQIGRDFAKEHSLKGADLLKRHLSQSIRSLAQTSSALVLYRSPKGRMKEWIKALVFGWLNFWQVPLYIAGSVPEVTASASLYRRLLSLKIKTNFCLILIKIIQPFNILMSSAIGCLGKTSQNTTTNCCEGSTTTLHFILPI